MKNHKKLVGSLGFQWYTKKKDFFKEGRTMIAEQIKIYSRYDKKIELKVIPGHFATSQSHVSYYLDMTTMKTRISEASRIAKALSAKYEISTPVDTIVCLDGLEVIGAYLAENLKKIGVLSYNAHKTIYVVAAEFDGSGQMIFRDNLKPMIRGKNVVLLNGSVTTGTTLKQALNGIEYYGGFVSGVSAVFSAINRVNGIDINAVYTKKDIPNYETYKASACPLCQKKVPIDAMVNSFGYSLL